MARPAGMRLGILGLTLVVLASVWTVVWRESARIEDTAFDAAARDAANLSRAFAQHARRTIAQVDEVLREVADRLVHDERLDLSQIHTRVPGLSEISRFIAVLDERGRAVTSSLPEALGVDYSDRDWYARAITEPPNIMRLAPPLKGRITGAMSMPLSMRVERPDGRAAGIIVASILSGYFNDFFASLDLGPNGTTALIDEAGIIHAAREPTPAPIGAKLVEHPLSSQTDLGDRGTFTLATAAGTRQVVGYERLRVHGLLVFTALAESDIRAEIAGAQRTLVVQGLVISALVLLLAGITMAHMGRADVAAARARETLASALRARQEAEHANASKSQFLATASHELRTPLNAILGFSELMEREIFGPLGNARYKEYMRDIQESGHHLLALINDLLDLAKIEAGRLDLHPEPVDVSGVAGTCVRLMQARAAAAGVTLTLTADPDIHAMADKVKIRQIILNLLSNAVKFTPEGGRVDLAVRRGQGIVLVAVRDSGPGMSPDEVRIALEPFGQLDSLRSAEREGTGLGLPLSKGLAELHGGGLTIDSARGVGTTVTVRIPAIPQAAVDAVPLADVLARRD